MDRNTALAALEPHAKRPIRAFLADPKVAGSETETAFWDLYYAGCRTVEHEHARLAEREMTGSGLPVSSVMKHIGEGRP